MLRDGGLVLAKAAIAEWKSLARNHVDLLAERSLSTRKRSQAARMHPDIQELLKAGAKKITPR